MKEPGPFDRILEPETQARDRSAPLIFVGMGLLGLILIVLVVSPFSIFGGGGDKGPSLAGPAGSASAKTPKVPSGYEALSRLFDDIQAPKGTKGPYALTVNLLQPVSDGRNLALYTYADGKWERLASATLVNSGSAATGEVAEMPKNVAVLRLTASAVQISGWLPAGAQPDQEALSVLTTVNPVDYAPNPDGTVAGSARSVPQANANVVPTIRASTPEQDNAVNTVLASPALRQEHISALVQIALQPGNAGIDVDYPRVNPARKADFTAFVTVLADQLHQANRTLSVTLPTPVKSGVSWDTGAYDWQEIGGRADTLKLRGVADPSVYYERMPEVLGFLKDKVDPGKVVLVIDRRSHEKASDGLRELSLHEALGLASEIEVRTPTQIAPNTSVVIVGKNIFQDDGASGLRWDEKAFAVSFEYPGLGGQRTVWIENAFSVAFRIDLARRQGLGGVAISDVSSDPALPAVLDTLRVYAESGNVQLSKPNGVLLRPTWQVQAGSSEAEAKGNIVWKAPPQPGSYDVSLVVSDGVIRAMRKVVLEVKPSTALP